jgi:ABC-type lipoprotein export system ATPase subunit
MITIKNISVEFGNRKIFNDASINIIENEFICIKGSSGSGKSTLLSIIGLLNKNFYDYTLDDVKINKKNREKIRKENFSYVFQDDLLIPYLSVYDNLIMPLRNLNKKIFKEDVVNLASKLGINDLLDVECKKLSGGERQRVSIARAILSNRRIMTVDEPTGNLDPTNAKIVMELLKKAQKEYNITIILVTHSNSFDSYFDKIYYIKDKKICLNN